MNCFYHPNKASIGICKCCSKGLCQECAVDLGEGLACKDKHEAYVKDINMIIKMNAKTYKAAPKNWMIAPFFHLFAGLIFMIFGYLSRDSFLNLAFFLGVGFIILAVITFYRTRDIFSGN